MTEATPSRRIQRQRERKAIKTADKAVVAAYNRDGLAGIVEGIGGGTVDHWDDSERGQTDE